MTLSSSFFHRLDLLMKKKRKCVDSLVTEVGLFIVSFALIKYTHPLIELVKISNFHVLKRYQFVYLYVNMFIHES